MGASIFINSLLLSLLRAFFKHHMIFGRCVPGIESRKIFESDGGDDTER